MERSLRRWCRGFLAALALLLAAAAATVYLCDPAFYYRLPPEGEAVFFNERCQSAGLIRNVPADTVVLGTSLTNNMRKSSIEAAFGGRGLRIVLPDGYLSEFDQAVDAIFRCQSPERVVFGLDPNILIRDESGLSGTMPGYLYDANPVNDLQYLLNKDMLYYSIYTRLAVGWGKAQTLDEGFTWQTGIWWNHMTALENYTRPDPADAPLPADSFRENAAANAAVIAAWAREHPETEFDVFFPPYSMLAWDRYQRQGKTEAVISAMIQTCETLLPLGNVRIHAPALDRDIVEQLDNYADHIHYSPDTADTVLREIAAGTYELTAETYLSALTGWQDFALHYDYEKYWDMHYWWQFHTN